MGIFQRVSHVLQSCRHKVQVVLINIDLELVYVPKLEHYIEVQPNVGVFKWFFYKFSLMEGGFLIYRVGCTRIHSGNGY